MGRFLDAFFPYPMRGNEKLASRHGSFVRCARPRWSLTREKPKGRVTSAQALPTRSQTANRR